MFLKLVKNFPVDLTEKTVSTFQKQIFYAKPERGNKDQLSVSTQRYLLAAVRTFCKWAFFEGHTNTNVSDRLEFPSNVKSLPRNILSQKDITKLFKSIDITNPEGFRDRAIFELLYSSGIRAHELLQLDLLDIDFDARTIHVRGKGGKERRVPVTHTAIEWLDAYIRNARPKLDTLNEPNAVFIAKFGKRLSHATINVRIQKHARRAGIATKVTAHVFRHTCATHLIKSRADLRYVQEFLGHASPNTTMVYTRVAITDLMEMHDKFHPRDRL